MRWCDLHSSAFVLTIRRGMIAEYKRRHDQIWPELVAALRTSGVVFYDIYLHEPSRQVFGQMLRTHPPQATSSLENPVILEWRRYMADVLEMDGDVPARLPIKRVFHLTA